MEYLSCRCIAGLYAFINYGHFKAFNLHNASPEFHLLKTFMNYGFLLLYIYKSVN